MKKQTPTYSGKDYLGSKAQSEELASTIRSYWAKLNKSPQVWVETEVMPGGENGPRARYRYYVRSNLVLDYRDWIKS